MRPVETLRGGSEGEGEACTKGKDPGQGQERSPRQGCRERVKNDEHGEDVPEGADSMPAEATTEDDGEI